MAKVKKAVFIIEYEQKDITADIASMINSITYIDAEHGESDEIEIEIADKDNLFLNAWFPTEGDRLRLYLGYEGEKLLDCGLFELDEPEFSGPPSIVYLKGLATNITKALRQKNTVGYEQKTLKQIAQEIADRHGYELIAEVEDIRFKRVTQNKERDLSFLKRVAEEYGYIFKISDNKLVFYQISKLHESDSIIELDRSDISYRLKYKTAETYKKCEVMYQDPVTKKLISFTVEDENIVKGDILKINERCENKQQAIIIGNASLKAKNNLKVEGTLNLAGNPIFTAGSNIELTNMGMLSGKYHISKVRHTYSKSSGYENELEVNRV